MESTYTTARVCDLFDISKSTLFRWENEPWFPSVARDRKEVRLYKSDHISAIAKFLYRQSINRRQEPSYKSQEDEGFYSFMVWRDEWSLKALGKVPLSSHTIKKLLRLALEDYEPEDELFRDIINLIQKQLESSPISMVPGLAAI